jgi:ABC-2 type transport system permease protein
MNTFKTLLLREWMQHRFGWLLLGSVPLAIMIPLMSFGQIQFDHEPPTAGLLALMFLAGYTLFALVLAGGAVAFQSPGLARRDVQDRSIEFWTSLPTSHTASVGATVLLNLLLMPLLVLAMAAVGGIVPALIAVVRVHGAAGLGQLPWGSLGPVVLIGLGRLALGVVLGVLWASPLLLAAMAASAWLKRWGVPVLGAVLGFGGLILDKAYDMPFVFDAIGALGHHFAWAVVPTGMGSADFEAKPWPGGQLAAFPSWIWHDTKLVLADLASPLFLGAIATAAACFALIVWRRSRG